MQSSISSSETPPLKIYEDCVFCGYDSNFLKHIFNNPFTPGFLKWNNPFLNLDLSTDVNRDFCLKSKNRKANSVDPDETLRAVSSGSTLFAQVSVLVRRAERINNVSQLWFRNKSNTSGYVIAL